MSQYHNEDTTRQVDEAGGKLTQKGSRAAGKAAGRAAKLARRGAKAAIKAAMKAAKVVLTKGIAALVSFVGVPLALFLLVILLASSAFYVLFESPGKYQQYADDASNEWTFNEEGDMVVTEDLVAPESMIIKDFYNYHSGISYYQVAGKDNQTLLSPDDDKALVDYYSSTDIFRLNANLLFTLDTHLFQGKVKYPEQFTKPVRYNPETLTLEPLVDEEGGVVALSKEIDFETGKETGREIHSVRDYGLASVMKFNQTEDWEKTVRFKWTYNRMDEWDEELGRVVVRTIHETGESLLPGYPEKINLVEKVISFAGEVQYSYDYRESKKEGIRVGASERETDLVEKYLYKVHKEQVFDAILDKEGNPLVDEFGMPIGTFRTVSHNLYKYRTPDSGIYETVPVPTGTTVNERGLKYFYDYVLNFESTIPSTALPGFSFAERIDYSSVAFDLESLIGATYSLPIGEGLLDQSKKRKFDRAMVYFPLVQKYSFEFGIEDPFVLLAMLTQESGGDVNLNQNGLMQITSSSYTVSQTAANRLGERVTVSVDLPERKDPDKSIRYAAAYLKRLLDKYDGNVLKAIQGYNFGEGTLSYIEKNHPTAWADEYAWMAYREEARLATGGAHTLSASYSCMVTRPSGTSGSLWGDSCYVENVLQYYGGHSLEKVEMGESWSFLTGSAGDRNMFVAEKDREKPDQWFDFKEHVHLEMPELILTATRTYDDKMYYSEVENFEEVNFWDEGFMATMSSIGLDMDGLEHLTGYYGGYAPPIILGPGVSISSPFGQRFHPIWKEYRFHAGVDVAAPTGTPLYAVADGTIEVARSVGGYGNYIRLDHGNNTHSRYAHLHGYAVTEGQRVAKGQLIGYVGSTGDSTGPHLHFEFHVNGVPIDPTGFIRRNIAEQALDRALTKVGSPYVWGAAGPNAFDCSGLVKWAYSQVGYTNMKRVTYEQINAGQMVPRSGIQRGDLIFFLNGTGGNATDHVAFYLGKNEEGIDMMLHAPRPGVNVEIRSVYWETMVGIRRFR